MQSNSINNHELHYLYADCTIKITSVAFLVTTGTIYVTCGPRVADPSGVVSDPDPTPEK